MSTDELIAEALKLSREERARFAEELFSSLEESIEVVEQSWAEELERRSDEISNGVAKTIPWETVREEILSQIEKRRASRISS